MSHALFPKLLHVLRQIDRPGSFAVGGSDPALLPGLEIADLGPLGLPLTAKQAKELKKHCEQAPYGKGQETLVDTSVRRVWRLTPDRFMLTNPDWNRFLEQTVQKVQTGLGLENQKLESHLYDLLLYEPGSFFLPHRDGEKLDRMVATLVIVLPSSFAGGELIVRHEGDEKVFDFGGAESNFRIHYAAFYADCEHEIRPLRAGHRLCLVYNLTLAKAKKNILAPRVAEPIEALRQILTDAGADEGPQKTIVTLSHQYTEGGLTWDALKGVDRAQAHVLLEAARRADWCAYLGVLTFHESGSAEYTGGSRYRRSWDEYGEGNDPSQYKMEEVYESSLTVDHLLDGEGKPLLLDSLNVDEEEIVDAKALKKVKPQEEFQGYTGNEGMTLERWYRHAAVVLWPKRRHFDALCAAGSRQAAQALDDLVKRGQSAGAKEAPPLRAEALAFAAAVVRTWDARQTPGFSYGETRACPLFPSLIALDEPDLIDAYLRSVLPNDATVDPGDSLASVCQKHGWKTFEESLQSAFQQTNSLTATRNSRLLHSLCLAKPGRKPRHRELCEVLTRTLFECVKKIDTQADANNWYMAHMDRTPFLIGLAHGALAAEQDELLTQLVDHILALPKKYPLLPAQMSALTILQPWIKKHVKRPCAPLSRWLAVCREQLEARTAEEPQPPADFRRDADISCKCADCAELKHFLQDPQEAEHRFRAAEQRRRHLEQEIRHRHCDLDCRTERQGSPHSLVCTKNTASYRERLKQYHEDRNHLALVRSLEANVPS